MTSPLDNKLGNVLGGKTATALQKGFGFVTVGDLLSHYPRTYAKRGELTALTQLPLDENVTIIAEVVKTSRRPMKNRPGNLLEVTITDGEGLLGLTFFNQAFRANDLSPGRRGMFTGKVTEFNKQFQLTNPHYELFDETHTRSPEEAREWAMLPEPIYRATASIQSWKIKDSIAIVLDTLPPLEDPVPQGIRDARKLMGYSMALDRVHRPTNESEPYVARKALRFQEAFVLQAALLQQRDKVRQVATAPRVGGSLLEQFDAALPFTLTSEQKLVGEEITRDLAAAVPMNRLVQGEVGSGKTLVALRAMLAVAQNGGQSALLAPTEVLAHQHLRSIVATLGPDLAARLRPTILTGQLPTAQRKKALLAAVSGGSSIIIGTHALLGEKVGFFDLGLVVVDEQHRFGVEQRESLRLKGATPPHVLVLTATPIPRTVAMTVFGDLDISTIAELPSGRSPIASHFVSLDENPGAIRKVWVTAAAEIDKGHQVFIVCPAIDPKEDEPGDAPEEDAIPGAPSANVTDLLESLSHNEILRDKRIAGLHGRMSGDEKDAIMRAFSAGQIDILVATTVIEVGVDVPNASTMVVLDADRFGVSQLHQLRGRVGRGGVQGKCIFVSRAKPETLARERVEAVASTLDGFVLAEKDLELRKEGDVLGSTQSGGRSSLRLLRAWKDGELISEARQLAGAILSEDPDLSAHEPLRLALERRLDAEAETFLSKN